MSKSQEQIKKIVRDVYDNYPHWSNYLEFGELVGKKVFDWVFDEIDKEFGFFLYKFKGKKDVAIPNLKELKEKLIKEGLEK